MNESSRTGSRSECKTRQEKSNHPIRRMKVISPFLVRAGYEAERQKLARGVHDLIGQPLTAMELIVGRMASSPAENSPLLEEMRLLICDTQTEVRELLQTLQPASDKLDLQLALNSLVARNCQYAKMQVNLQNSGLSEAITVPADVIQAVLHIIQESLTNVSLHSGVNEATVKVSSTNGNINVQVEDKGAGFDPSDITFTCFGLNSMYQTACLAQGTLIIESAPGAGTRIIAKFPVVKQPRSIMLVDDHPIIRRGLKALLETQSDF